ncbi:hypothetical protein FI667_g799, partial [Globisporangium splendens]
MGQTISFLYRPERKRIARIGGMQNARESCSSINRQSSVDGRLRSYGVILHESPSPRSNHGEETRIATPLPPPGSPPSPVVNDMITTQKKDKQPSQDSLASQDDVEKEIHFDSAFTPSPAASAPTVRSDALAPTIPVSLMVPHPPTTQTPHAHTSIARSPVAAYSSHTPYSSQSSQLPNLRMSELEQLFVAIVKGGEDKAHKKLALHS